MANHHDSKGALTNQKSKLGSKSNSKPDVKAIVIGIFLVVVCTLMNAFGQLFMRFGARNVQNNIFTMVTNPFIISGYVLFFIGSLFLVYALKNNQLSIMYPFVSLGFIWVALLSLLFLGERLIFWQWAGLVLIIIGISSVTKGAMYNG